MTFYPVSHLFCLINSYTSEQVLGLDRTVPFTDQKKQKGFNMICLQMIKNILKEKTKGKMKKQNFKNISLYIQEIMKISTPI